MYLPDNALLQGGKYRIVRHISSGGFGNTYEGVHTMMDTKVAIKEFFPKMFCNRDETTSNITVATHGNSELVDKLRKKFIEEAKAIFKMNHPNIVKVHDIFEENGSAYFVMDYVDGRSLGDIVKQRGHLPETEAAGYIRQVAAALRYVHSLNRLHLDIKPGNVLVDKQGHAFLIDFGASKHYDMESGENTSTLMGINTKGYAPVEQSTQSFSKFSPATDIYALGATLYKLLTGITPPDANLLLAKEVSLQPMPDNISAATRNAVRHSMALIRADRPQSIDDFLSLLDGKQDAITDDEETICEVKEERSGNENSRNSVKEEEKPKALKTNSKPENKAKSHRLRWVALGTFGVAGVVVVLAILFAPTMLNKINHNPSSVTADTVKATNSIKTTDSVKVTVSVEKAVEPKIDHYAGHEYVDLGLPSGLKWATCNVGASKPEEYGSYFAWGETSPKSTYTEENSKTDEKSTSQLRSSGMIGSNGNLTSSYDAARKNWGGSWRMPTLAEVQELIDNTTTTWTTQNGVKGRKITSKRNGKSIFLPAAGFRGGGSLSFGGTGGYYWSSAPCEDMVWCAYGFGFCSGGFGWGDHGSYRYEGQSVRPVSE